MLSGGVSLGACDRKCSQRQGFNCSRRGSWCLTNLRARALKLVPGGGIVSSGRKLAIVWFQTAREFDAVQTVKADAMQFESAKEVKTEVGGLDR